MTRAVSLDELELFQCHTPGGRPLQMLCRVGTSDRGIVSAVAESDEYGLAGLRPGGPCIDVGAHIGGVAVALALDHGVGVVAVEPVPENAALLAANAALNGVADLIGIDTRAASRLPWTVIRYGWPGGHFYVGGLGEGEPSRMVRTGVVSLGALLDEWKLDRVALLKIDMEGGEVDWLSDSALDRVALVVGESHNERLAAASGRPVLHTENHFRILAP